MQYRRHVRVDERLIHGQVLVKWLGICGSDMVLIVDDAMKGNPILQSIMQRTLPKSYQLRVLQYEELAGFLEREKFRGDPFILVRELADVKRLEEEGVMFEEINIARMPYIAGKEKVCDSVYINQDEKDIINHFLNKGSRVFVQMVPDSERICLDDILKCE